MSETPKQLKSVGILIPSDYWYLMIAFAREIKERYGAKIHFYVGNDESQKYLRQCVPDEFYDSLTSFNFQDDNYLVKDKSKADEIIKKATAWEEYLGCTYQELIAIHRQFGGGYAMGAPYYPSSHKSRHAGYLDVLNFYNNDLDFWHKELTEKSIDLFITPLKPVHMLSKVMGFPVRELVVAKYEDYFIWSQDEFIQNRYLKSEYKKLEDEEFAPKAMDKGIIYDHENRKKLFNARMEYWGLIKEAVGRIFHRTMHIIKKDQARFGNEVISSLLVKRRLIKNKKKLLDPKFITPFEEFKDTDFFYFPLQHEPELSLQGCSQDFMSQHWAILLAAKSLPANAQLVVKEHIYPMGMRPDKFYDHIAKLKNVKLAPLDVYGLDMIRHAKGTITMTGTSGYEAAMMGKPAIIMGTKCDYNVMDHVFHCPRGDGMEQAVKKIMDDKIDMDLAAKDGARLIEAIKNSAFKISDFTLSNRDQVKDEDVKGAIDNLEMSLANPAKMPYDREPKDYKFEYKEAV